MESIFTKSEHEEFIHAYRQLLRSVRDVLDAFDIKQLRRDIALAYSQDAYRKDMYGLNPLLRNIQTARIVSEEIGLKQAAVISVLLSGAVLSGKMSVEDIEKKYGADVSGIINGLIKTQELYAKNAVIETDNFRKLLLSFAEDLRVVLVMIADRLYLMRVAKHFQNEALRMKIVAEASYLYAPLAHKLGLYKIKSELEDLSLKFRDRETYGFIARKINETKASRDKYIASFIAPIENKLSELNLKFDIKGRTKSISSINSKLQKQKVEFENIYDLFAIRVILDSPVEKEKSECWQAYSIITDMYQPNPKRLKDWLSIPKSNGYESLHVTVMGPEGRWVEIQIRTKRMDEIAEKGLAAHWKYKGIKGENGLDNWLNNVREVLESKDDFSGDLMQDFKMDLYDEEIFVFTPKGDLFKLPKNATVLDFAFAIHTKLGSKCVSAKINGKNVTIRHRLKSGDQVDIQTSPNQSPKQDWLNFVITSKARIKIKQTLKEAETKQVEFAKERLNRRFKNRKMEEDESTLMRLIKKIGYKKLTDFYADIAAEKLDVNTVIDQYSELEKKEAEIEHADRSVENFRTTTLAEEIAHSDDALIIDQNLTGIEYKLAKCCNPIFGDEIFASVSSHGGIKIHRDNCPNAPALRKREGNRMINARWSGKSLGSYSVTLKIVGNDDIGIVANITSIISKENGMTMRSISVDSSDGLFQGNITVLVNDTSVMNALIKKIEAVKGVKRVTRGY